jgi:membrane-bound metal-dependent hydrolase YbcI (DUF457 family)
MFAGHFGLAAIVKAKQPEVPLWPLMLSTQLLDVLFVPAVLTNLESLETPAGGGYGEAVIHAYYTHSLVGALLISLAMGLFGRWKWGNKTGLILGLMVFSHWLLDLLVHKADLPLLPGNLGNLPLLGFGLWSSPLVSILVELALITAGATLYFFSALARSKPLGKRNWAILTGSVMSLLLLLALLTDTLGLG